MFLLNCFWSLNFFSALLFATVASITDFAVGAAAVKDLDGAIEGVAEIAGDEGGGNGVATLWFFSGFCSKGWATFFS